MEQARLENISRIGANVKAIDGERNNFRSCDQKQDFFVTFSIKIPEKCLDEPLSG